MNTEHPLRAYRSEHNLSLDRAATKLRMSKASLSRIENGVQMPSPTRARRLSEITGIPAKNFRPDLAEIFE